VDCVITSKEILMLAASRDIDLLSLPRQPLPSASFIPFPDPKLDRFLFPYKYNTPRRSKKQQEASAGTSGGHLWYILKHVSSLNAGSTIQSTRGRNVDVIDYTVTSSSGEILFKAARYYGFRNIQNLVRRLKPARPSRMPGGRPVGGARRPGQKENGPEQAYVEVMACPGGCTNGGGQIKFDDPIVSDRPAKQAPQDQKEWLAQVDEAYFSSEENIEDNDIMNVDEADDSVDGISPSYIRDTLAHWAALTGFDLNRLVYTSYREVVSDVGKKVGDTERVVQLAGKIGGGW